MDGLSRVVYLLVVALIVLSSVIVFALIFVPEFANIAPTLIAAVLGPLTTAISVLGGILASRGITKAAEEEVSRKTNGAGEESG